VTANADTITVAAGATYSAAGTLDNTGVIDFQGGSVGAPPPPGAGRPAPDPGGPQGPGRAT